MFHLNETFSQISLSFTSHGEETVRNKPFFCSVLSGILTEYGDLLANTDKKVRI